MLNALLNPPSRDQIIALAGIFLACHQVDSYARLGAGSLQDLETAISCLLNQNPETTESVYHGIGNLESGLASMEKVLADPKNNSNGLVLRYVIGVMYIARKLSANRKMLGKISEGIARASRQAETFTITHSNVIANIADLYQQTISTLTFRIQVSGVAAHLQQPTIANKIRCLLFSAVRSAILWQQVKGSRFHLMFRRDKILAITKEVHKEARLQST